MDFEIDILFFYILGFVLLLGAPNTNTKYPLIIKIDHRV